MIDPDRCLSAASHPVALVALHAGYSHSSLAIRSLAAFCRNEPFHAGIQLFEAQVNVSHQTLLEELVAWQPRLIGFSCYLWNIDACIRLAQLLKQLLPECRIVFGGPEAGPRGEALLRAVPVIDFVVDGEGEAAFRDLLRWQFAGVGELSTISGLVWWDQDQIHRNPIRLLPVEQIPSTILLGSFDAGKPLIYWETSRGCPYKCTFCTSATDRLRAFPIERVEQELAVLSRLKGKTIKLLDRSFHLGKQRTLRLLQRFAEAEGDLRFHLELNPDRISAEAMVIFRHAEPGRFQFEIGLQTLNEPVLNAIERQMEVSKALDNIRKLVAMKRHPVHLDLIVGLPGEDAAHCADSLNRVFRLFPEHLQLGSLKLLPGTPLHDQAQMLGYRWDPQPPYEVLAHPLLSFQAFARFKRYAALLERLWNSGYLVATLMRLVPHHFNNELVRFFDTLMEQLGEGIAREKMQPERLFGRLVGFLEPWLDGDPLLQELLLWDYANFTLPNRNTPAWIAVRIDWSQPLVVDGSRRRLPVLRLSAAAVSIINRRRLGPLQAGRYGVWPRQHKRGKPVTLVSLTTE